MFELICCGFAALFLGALAVCCVMGATRLKREREEELEYQRRLNEGLRERLEIMEGEPT